MSEKNTVNMEVNENTNINATVTLTNEQGVNTQVMYLNASLNADTLGLNINVNVIDKVAYKNNAKEMKAKYLEFKQTVEDRATTLGYIIF